MCSRPVSSVRLFSSCQRVSQEFNCYRRICQRMMEVRKSCKRECFLHFLLHTGLTAATGMDALTHAIEVSSFPESRTSQVCCAGTKASCGLLPGRCDKAGRTISASVTMADAFCRHTSATQASQPLTLLPCMLCVSSIPTFPQQCQILLTSRPGI